MCEQEYVCQVEVNFLNKSSQNSHTLSHTAGLGAGGDSGGDDMCVHVYDKGRYGNPAYKALPI